MSRQQRMAVVQERRRTRRVTAAMATANGSDSGGNGRARWRWLGVAWQWAEETAKVWVENSEQQRRQERDCGRWHPSSRKTDETRAVFDRALMRQGINFFLFHSPRAHSSTNFYPGFGKRAL